MHSAVRKEGCCFLCTSYLVGLNNFNEADECWEWATSQEKVRDDSWVNINKDVFAGEITNRYGRNRRSGRIVQGNNHFYVVNAGGVEIFNSISPGYGH